MRAYLVGGGLAVTLAAFLVTAQTPQNRPVELHTLHVQGNVYMITGGGGNVTVQWAATAFCWSIPGWRPADLMIAAMRKLSEGSHSLLINTHVHPDHMGGNEKIVAAKLDQHRRQCHRRYWGLPGSAPPSWRMKRCSTG